jgi:hypothetical protein
MIAMTTRSSIRVNPAPLAAGDFARFGMKDLPFLLGGRSVGPRPGAHPFVRAPDCL